MANGPQHTRRDWRSEPEPTWKDRAFAVWMWTWGLSAPLLLGAVALWGINENLGAAAILAVGAVGFSVPAVILGALLVALLREALNR